MANEQAGSKKKPPAHEVIIGLLQDYQREERTLHDDVLRDGAVVAKEANIAQRAIALCTVLMFMHIPEKDQSWVISALKELRFLPMAADLIAEIEAYKGGA